MYLTGLDKMSLSPMFLFNDLDTWIISMAVWEKAIYFPALECWILAYYL